MHGVDLPFRNSPQEGPQIMNWTQEKDVLLSLLQQLSHEAMVLCIPCQEKGKKKECYWSLKG